MKKIITSVVLLMSLSTILGQTNTFPTSGNVGIGTTTPTQRLEVIGGNILSGDSNGTGGALFLGNPGHGIIRESNDIKIITAGEGVIKFSNNLWNNGNTEFMRIANNGNVGIGTDTPKEKLDVNGTSTFAGNMKVSAKVEAKEVKVTSTPTADFVFSENYPLPKLEEVEKHIKEKKHLPEIASAKEMEKEGVNVGEFQIKLLQKIEELTLYSIKQNKEIKKLQKENSELKEQSKKIERLEKQLLELTSRKQ